MDTRNQVPAAPGAVLQERRGQSAVRQPAHCPPGAAAGAGRRRAAAAAPPPHASACALRCSCRLAKAQLRLLSAHPWSFQAAGCLAPSLRAAAEEATRAPLAPRGPLPALALRTLSTALASPAFRPPPPAGSISSAAPARSAEEAAARQSVQAELWQAALPDSTQHALLEALLASHLRLTRDDLELWHLQGGEALHLRLQAEPAAGAVADACGDDARPHALSLLLALLAARRQQLAPGLVARLAQMARSGDAWAAEAALAALGCCAYELHDAVRLADWWAGLLQPLLTGREAELRPLRRRAAWVLGQWVAQARARPFLVACWPSPPPSDALPG